MPTITTTSREGAARTASAATPPAGTTCFEAAAPTTTATTVSTSSTQPEAASSSSPSRFGTVGSRDTTTAAGNGAGFKAGGYGSPRNRAQGFYANHHPGRINFVNNTAFRNSVNYNMLADSGYPSDHVLRNNVAMAPGTAISNLTGGTATYNSWNLDVTVEASDFLSLEEAEATAARNADGSLPDIDFVHLAAGSDLIDAGTEVGLPFVGRAPDLGAFEYGANNGTGGSGGTGGTDGTGAVGGSGGAGGTGGATAGTGASGGTGGSSSSCTAPLELCSDSCVSLSSDPRHCGACDAACDESAVCSNAVCTTSGCDQGLVPCDRSCVDLATDLLNCSECGTVCLAGQACVASGCTGTSTSDLPASEPGSRQDLGESGGCGCSIPGRGRAAASFGFGLGALLFLLYRRRSKWRCSAARSVCEPSVQAAYDSIRENIVTGATRFESDPLR